MLFVVITFDGANILVVGLPGTRMNLTLYALEGCPDCESVMASLEVIDASYSVRWVDARFSSRDAVKRVSGQRSVPVLVDEASGAVLATQSGIEAYIERTVA